MIRVSWKIFGSNGYIEQPKSVVKHFTKRATCLDALIKNIFRVVCVENFDLHHVDLKVGYEKISVPGTPLTSYSIAQTEENLIKANIHLNHYRVQSREYWNNSKMKRGDFNRDNAHIFLNMEYFESLDKLSNTTTDTELYHKHQVMYDDIDNHKV